MRKRQIAILSLVVSMLFTVATAAKAQDILLLQHKRSEIVFEGNKIFTSEQLFEQLDKCVASPKIHNGLLDSGHIEYCLGKQVLPWVQSQGYLQATLKFSAEQEKAAGSKPRIVVNEGLRHRLGNIEIEGLKFYTAEQVREMLPLQTGDIANGRMIREWLYDTLKKDYANHGCVQYEAEIEPIFQPPADGAGGAIVDFKINIYEGSQFIIRRIEFTGNTRTQDKTIRNALSINEDEVYNQQRFEKSIEDLNSLGLFEWIDKDRDMQFRADKEAPLVDIIISFKELP